MAISLMDLNGSALPPNETQVATIAHEVSCYYPNSLGFGVNVVGANGT